MPQVGFDVKEISGRHSDRMIIGEGNTCLSPAGATRVNAHIRASVTLLYIYILDTRNYCAQEMCIAVTFWLMLGNLGQIAIKWVELGLVPI